MQGNIKHNTRRYNTKYNTMIVVHPFKPFDAIPVLYQQFQINLTVFVFAIGFYIVFIFISTPTQWQRLVQEWYLAASAITPYITSL